MSHSHLSPHRIAVLSGYALVIGLSLGEAPSTLLQEVVATFIPLSLAAKSLCECSLAEAFVLAQSGYLTWALMCYHQRF